MACPAWEFMAGTLLIKLSRMQNKVTVQLVIYQGAHGFMICLPTSYIHDYRTKLCRQQVQVIQNHETENIRKIGQGEDTQHRKYRKLKLSGSQAYNHSSDYAVCGTEHD
jgi:hypothetical protein